MSDTNQYIGSQSHGFDVQEKAILPEPRRPHLIELFTPQVPAPLPPHITLFATSDTQFELGSIAPFATIFENGNGVLSCRANEFPLGASDSTAVETDSVISMSVPEAYLVDATDKRLLYTLTVTNDDGDFVSQSILVNTVPALNPVSANFPVTISVDSGPYAPEYSIGMDFPLGKPFQADYVVFTLINSGHLGNVCSSSGRASLISQDGAYSASGTVIWGVGGSDEGMPFVNPLVDSILVTEFFQFSDGSQDSLVHTQIDVVQLPL